MRQAAKPYETQTLANREQKEKHRKRERGNIEPSTNKIQAHTLSWHTHNNFQIFGSS